MQKDKKMIFSTKVEKELLKNEICKASINASRCLSFVAMQECTDKAYHEFKKLNELCDKLDNIWDYLDFCIENDVNADISRFSYNLILSSSAVDIKDYKLYYRDYGEFQRFYE